MNELSASIQEHTLALGDLLVIYGENVQKALLLQAAVQAIPRGQRLVVQQE